MTSRRTLGGPGSPWPIQGFPGAGAGRPAHASGLAGIVPFAVYVLLGLGLPTVAIAFGAFQHPVTAGFTLNNSRSPPTASTCTDSRSAFELAVITSVDPGILAF